MARKTDPEAYEEDHLHRSIRSVKRLLDRNQRKKIIELTASMHAADTADLIEALDNERREKIVNILRKDFDPEILATLEEDVRDQVVHWLRPEEIAEAISELESDDAVFVIEDMDQEEQKQILESISSKDRLNIETALSFPEDSAGRLMQRGMVVAPEHWTIKEVIGVLRKNQTLPDTFYDVFIVDPKLKPVGYVPLSVLLHRSEKTKLREVMRDEVQVIPANMDQEEVAFLFRQYGFVSAPVVDESGRIIGIITVDDVVNVIEEEATEDILHLGGVAESDIRASAFDTSYWRFRWLFVTFINTLIASAVIYQFQDALEEIVALAVLMPIVAAMGGNAGMQAVTVTVRALAMKALHEGNIKRMIVKEMAVGAINGCIFAILLASIASLWYHDLKLGLVLAAAMAFNTVWAGLAGIVFPLLVDRLNLDPAVAAGPILTTTTDVLGFASFLGLATYFLL